VVLGVFLGTPKCSAAKKWRRKKKMGEKGGKRSRFIRKVFNWQVNSQQDQTDGWMSSKCKVESPFRL
jgi:hypothetical protein